MKYFKSAQEGAKALSELGKAMEKFLAESSLTIDNVFHDLDVVISGHLQDPGQIDKFMELATKTIRESNIDPDVWNLFVKEYNKIPATRLDRASRAEYLKEFILDIQSNSIDQIRAKFKLQATPGINGGKGIIDDIDSPETSNTTTTTTILPQNIPPVTYSEITEIMEAKHLISQTNILDEEAKKGINEAISMIKQSKKLGVTSFNFSEDSISITVGSDVYTFSNDPTQAHAEIYKIIKKYGKKGVDATAWAIKGNLNLKKHWAQYRICVQNKILFDYPEIVAAVDAAGDDYSVAKQILQRRLSQPSKYPKLVSQWQKYLAKTTKLKFGGPITKSGSGVLALCGTVLVIISWFKATQKQQEISKATPPVNLADSDSVVDQKFPAVSNYLKNNPNPPNPLAIKPEEPLVPSSSSSSSDNDVSTPPDVSNFEPKQQAFLKSLDNQQATWFAKYILK